MFNLMLMITTPLYEMHYSMILIEGCELREENNAFLLLNERVNIT